MSGCLLGCRMREALPRPSVRTPTRPVLVSPEPYTRPGRERELGKCSKCLLSDTVTSMALHRMVRHDCGMKVTFQGREQGLDDRTSWAGQGLRSLGPRGQRGGGGREVTLPHALGALGLPVSSGAGASLWSFSALHAGPGDRCSLFLSIFPFSGTGA